MFTLVKKISKFTSDAAGLEKTLRLLQSLVQIVAFYSLSPAPWLQARKQLALGRRYFRILKWIDAFRNSYEAFISKGGLEGVLEVGKWSCLGCYFGLEMLTILDAMGVHKSPWAADVFLEANKFWFYSIMLSLLLGIIQLWDLEFGTPSFVLRKRKGVSDGQVEREEAAWFVKRGTIVRRLVIDGCDVFIPGYATGWIVVSSTGVGMAGVVSTLLASMDIWERV